MASSTTSCTLCGHADRAALDAAIDAGVSISEVARRAGTSRTSVRRHQAHRVAGGFARHAQLDVSPPPVDHPVPSDSAVLAPKEAPSSISSTPRLTRLEAISLDAIAEEARAVGAAPATPPAEDLLAVFEEVQQERPAERPRDPDASPRAGKGRLCAVCASPKRRLIERLLCEGRPAAVIEREVSPGPSDGSIKHHARVCLVVAIQRARGDADAEILTSVRGRVQGLLERAERLVEDAEGDTEASARDRAATITAAKGVLELLAKILGEIRTEVDLRVIMGSPHMVAVLEGVRRALRRHPEARADVAAELEALEAGQAPRLVSGS